MTSKPVRAPAFRAWRWLKPVTDALVIVAAFVLAYLVRYEWQWLRQLEPAYYVPFRVYVPSIAALTAILLAVLWIEGAYADGRGRGIFDEGVIVLRSTLLGISAMIVMVFIATPTYYSRLIFGYTGIICVALLAIARTIERYIINGLHRQGRGVVRLLIVGAGEIGQSIMRACVARPELGYQMVGFVDDNPERGSTDIGRFKALGTLDQLPDLIVDHQVDEVVVALPWQAHRRILEVVAAVRAPGRARAHRARPVPAQPAQMVVENLDGIPLIGVGEPRLAAWERVVKRGIDLFGAVVGLVVLSPLLGALALAVRLDSPGPLIFQAGARGAWRQRVYLLQVPHHGAERRGAASRPYARATRPMGRCSRCSDDPRRTRMGKFLRRTSLDELPQLWNVLRGEMSMMGPRPGHAQRGGPIRALASAPPGGGAGHYRPVAGERAQRCDL